MRVLVLTPCNFQYNTHGLQPSSPSNSGRDVSISRSLPPSFFSSSRWTSSADLNLRHKEVVCVLQLGHVLTLINNVHTFVKKVARQTFFSRFKLRPPWYRLTAELELELVDLATFGVAVDDVAFSKHDWQIIFCGLFGSSLPWERMNFDEHWGHSSSPLPPAELKIASERRTMMVSGLVRALVWLVKFSIVSFYRWLNIANARTPQVRCSWNWREINS